MEVESGDKKRRQALLKASAVVASVLGLALFRNEFHMLADLFFIIVPMCLAMLVVHELGHVLAAALAGFRFEMLILGPLQISREGNRLALKFNRCFYLFGAVSVPMDERNLRPRIALTFLGGPIASLLTGVILSCVFSKMSLVISATDPTMNLRIAFQIGIYAATLLSFIIAIITIFPSNKPGAANDGSRALRVLRSGPQGEREAGLFALLGQARTGRRPREWHPKLIDAVTALSDDSLYEVSGLMLAYNFQLDKGDIEAAGKTLDSALSKTHLYPTIFRTEIYLEAAYFNAIFRKDATSARKHLTQADKANSFVEKATYCRAEAATLFAEGDFEGATKRVEEGLLFVGDKSLYERERLQSILTRERAELL